MSEPVPSDLTPVDVALRDALLELTSVTRVVVADLTALRLATLGNVPDEDVTPRLDLLTQRLQALPVVLQTDDLDRVP